MPNIWIKLVWFCRYLYMKSFQTNNVMWHGEKHFELFIYNENLFYAWRDKKMIRAYVNTPATDEIAIAD